MKGITPVISIILLMLITISMVGFAFVFFGGFSESTSESGESMLSSQISQAATTFRLDNYNENYTVIRNIGSETMPISNILFFVNDVKVDITTRCYTAGMDKFNSGYINSNEVCQLIPIVEKTSGQSYDVKIDMFKTEEYSFIASDDINACEMLRDLITAPGWLGGGSCSTNPDSYDFRGDLDKDQDVDMSDSLEAANCANFGDPANCKAIMLDTCNPCEETCTPIAC